MGIEMNDLFITVNADQADIKTAFQRQGDFDRVVTGMLKGKQTGADHGFSFRQAAKSIAQRRGKRRKDSIRRNFSGLRLHFSFRI